MFFIYKSLAHPELAGNYVQPFTLDERLAHARQAEKQLGATVPWLVDAMDNRLKHALGDRANSEFIVDPTRPPGRHSSGPLAVNRRMTFTTGTVTPATSIS